MIGEFAHTKDEHVRTDHPTPAWYAVHVRRSNERRVHGHLTLKAISAFLPLVGVPRYSRTRPRTVIEPLFPGYLFAQLEPIEANPEGWQAVRWAPGVKRILGTEATPVPVPPEAIAFMQARMNELGFIRSQTEFAPRSPVIFRRGPFKGLRAIVDSPTSRAGRLRVLMGLLGQQTSLEVDVSDLEYA
jgi:transcriptional antiterminator RfaH